MFDYKVAEPKGDTKVITGATLIDGNGGDRKSTRLNSSH